MLNLVDTIENKEIDELNYQFSWYCNSFGANIQSAFNEFYGDKFQLKLVSLSKNINVLFQGDNYFVTKIRINKNYDVYFRCSSEALRVILDDVLGENPNYDISAITDVEAKIISSFNDFAYGKIIDFLEKPDKNVKRKNFDVINLTFFVKGKSNICGKFIITVPKDLVKVEVVENEPYDVSSFNASILDTTVKIGTTRFNLKDLKSLEVGDTVVFENSDIHRLYIKYKDYENDFQPVINENIILQEDFDEGEDMSEKELPQNLWDSIQVDMGAQLDSVKVTLGELKSIAKGQVMDLSSIYDSKVSLIVENRVVAKGELVIVNDRYGVKVDEVFEALAQDYNAPSEPAPVVEEVPEEVVENVEEVQQVQEPQEQQPEQSEEFDYSDFNLDEQDI